MMREGLTRRFVIVKTLLVFLNESGYVVSCYDIYNPLMLLQPVRDGQPVTDLTKDNLRTCLNRGTIVLEPVAKIADCNFK